MVVRSRILAPLLALLVAGVFAACGDDDDEGTGAGTTATTAATETTATTTPDTEASVEFVEPADGATVTSPVHVEMTATNFTIEPAGEGTVEEGSGHFHIMVDTDCVAVGQTIPSDDAHLHFGTGATEAELELAPGSHTLCLQAGDAAHTALDLTDTITIEVTA